MLLDYFCPELCQKVSATFVYDLPLNPAKEVLSQGNPNSKERKEEG